MCNRVGTFLLTLFTNFNHSDLGLFRKGKIMFNFYFIKALGQNLANSESCLILRFL